MKIELKRELNSEYEGLDIPKGRTIEEVYQEVRDTVPYQVVAAKMDNRIVELTRIIDTPCTIEFLDIRTIGAYLIYQNSVSLIYLAALYNVLGDVEVTIANSLNRGIFTEVMTKEAITDEEVKLIEDEMRRMIQEDMPIDKIWMRGEDVIRFFEDFRFTEKLKVMLKKDNRTMYRLYKVGDYMDFFFTKMVPSTGYINAFELKRYRRGILLRFPHPKDPTRLPDYVDEKKMYEAFSEAKRWQNILGIHYVNDLNKKVEEGDMREIVQLSEALQEQKIVEISKNIIEQKKRIILIAGPTSSGKTTFARRLSVQLKVNGLKPLYLGTDDYFLDRHETPLDEDGNKNFEDLEAIDIKLFNQQMNDLLAGKEVDIPTFNFLSGVKEFGNRKEQIQAGAPIIIEGIHALNGALTAAIPDEEKYKIYISPLTQLNVDKHNRIPTTDARMLRRLVRDYSYRGHNAASTIDQWPRVRKGEDKNIFPYNGEADAFFNSNHIYEVAFLKKYAEPLLQEVRREQAEYAEAQRLLDFLSFFDVCEDEDLIPNNSILREFIGGSVFV